jgi:hypothetical protein
VRGDASSRWTDRLEGACHPEDRYENRLLFDPESCIIALSATIFAPAVSAMPLSCILPAGCVPELAAADAEMSAFGGQAPRS